MPLHPAHASAPARETSSPFTGLSGAGISLEEQLESSRRLLHAISQVHADFISHGDHRPIFEQLLVLILEMTHSERGAIVELLHPPGQPVSLQLHASRGWPAALSELEGLMGSALSDGQPVLVPPSEASQPMAPGLAPFLGLPFKLQGEVVGVLAVGLRSGGYDASFITLLQPVLTTCGTLLHARREAERRRRGEEALLAQQGQMKKLALVAARTDNAVIITDPTGRTEWVNEGFTRITGYSLEEAVGHKPGELLQGPLTDQQQIAAMSQALQRGEGVSVELLNYNKSGKSYWNLIEIQPVHDASGRLVQFVAIESDVTARKQLEQQVAQSVDRLRLALDSAEEGLWDWDLNTGQLTISPRWLTMLGYEPAAQASIELWRQQLCHPEDLPEVDRRLDEHLAGRSPMYEFEHRLRQLNGGWMWVLSRAKVVARDEHGRALRVVGTNADITSRRRAQEQLQAFIQAIPDTIFRVRVDGTCTGFKPSILEPTLLSPEKLVGHNLFAQGLPESMVSQLRAALERVAHDSSLEIFEYSMPMPFGVQQYEARVVPSAPDEGMCIMRNITARKLVEEQRRRQQEQLEERVRHVTRELESRQAQLIQSEKLASLGQMAASIAHEINNPVGYVSSNVSTLGGYVAVLRRLIEIYLQMEEALGSEVPAAVTGLLEQAREVREQERLDELLQDMDDLLADSKEGTARIREFILDLKTFVREESGTPQQSDLNKLLQVTLRMLRHELKHKCQVRLDFGPMPLVRCFPTQLNQVFMNLLLNAAQAIEPRGDIHITTRREGNDAVVWIRDTGRGMTEETKEKLFTPFFTTKPPGQGTGLGLSICYAIISRHKGRIDVDSELGKGTTFVVRIPLTE